MKCGKCKDRDVTIEHVRVCYGQASTGMPSANRDPDEHVGNPTSFPAGRYAVEMADGKLHFFKVDRPTEGRWAGYTFVKEQVSEEYWPVRGPRRAEVLGLIEEDPEEAMLTYGKELGHCGHCGRTLTNDESRAAGIGPVCRGKLEF